MLQGCNNIVYNAYGSDKVVTTVFPKSKAMTGFVAKLYNIYLNLL